MKLNFICKIMILIFCCFIITLNFFYSPFNAQFFFIRIDYFLKWLLKLLLFLSKLLITIIFISHDFFAPNVFFDLHTKSKKYSESFFSFFGICCGSETTRRLLMLRQNFYISNSNAFLNLKMKTQLVDFYNLFWV